MVDNSMCKDISVLRDMSCMKRNRREGKGRVRMEKSLYAVEYVIKDAIS